jgi:hypothetical protein
MFNKEYSLIKQAGNCVLTQCGKTLIEKLTVTHLVKKLPGKMGQGNSSEFRHFLGLLKPSAYLITGNLSKNVNPVLVRNFLFCTSVQTTQPPTQWVPGHCLGKTAGA